MTQGDQRYTGALLGVTQGALGVTQGALGVIQGSLRHRPACFLAYLAAWCPLFLLWENRDVLDTSPRPR